MIVASTVAGLGSGHANGTPGIIRTGTGVNEREELLFWHSSPGSWVGRPKTSQKSQGTQGGKSQGAYADWLYAPQGSGIEQAHGFQSHQVRNAKLFWEAGLRIQENLSGHIWATSGEIGQIACNWYDLNPDSGFLSPAPENPGVPLTMGYPQDEYQYGGHLYSSGWQNSPIDGPTNADFYPLLYVRGANGQVFKAIHAQYRWVGGNLGSNIGPDDGTSTWRSAFTTKPMWHRFEADAIGAEHLTPVYTWPSHSGFASNLTQPVSGARPILHREGLNGHSFVRFDGVDDSLVMTTAGIGAPITIMLVIRQNAGGPTQEGWYGGSAGGPIFYKGNATNQVNLWAGGSDLSYNRSTNYPMDWTVITVEQNAAASNIWENLTLKATGNPGGGGLAGFMLGNSAFGLPGKVDIATAYVWYESILTTQEREDTITYLMNKYGL